MYLGNINNCIVNYDDKILQILLFTCKIAITRNWYKTESPTTEQWLEILREICAMEKMTYQLRVREFLLVNASDG